jgi:hypothetical protein
MDLDHGQRRPLRITIRLSVIEHTRLLNASDRAGLTLSAYARFMLIEAKPPRRSRRPSFDRRVLARILAELGQLAALLRSIASVLRSAAHTPVFMVERDLARALKQLADSHTRLMQALGRKVPRP